MSMVDDADHGHDGRQHDQTSSAHDRNYYQVQDGADVLHVHKTLLNTTCSYCCGAGKRYLRPPISLLTGFRAAYLMTVICLYCGGTGRAPKRE